MIFHLRGRRRNADKNRHADDGAPVAIPPDVQARHARTLLRTIATEAYTTRHASIDCRSHAAHARSSTKTAMAALTEIRGVLEEYRTAAVVADQHCRPVPEIKYERLLYELNVATTQIHTANSEAHKAARSATEAAESAARAYDHARTDIAYARRTPRQECEA